MFTKLTDTIKAAIFSVLVLCLAVEDALLLRMLDLPQNTLTGTLGLGALWMCTPTVATLIVLLLMKREGYSKEGWNSLGLHRLGLSVWWIAFGVTLLVTVVASAILWATPSGLFSLAYPHTTPDVPGTLLDYLGTFWYVELTNEEGREVGWDALLMCISWSQRWPWRSSWALADRRR